MKTWIIESSNGSVMNTVSYHIFHQCHCVPSNAIIPHNISRRAQYMSNNRFSMPPHVSKKRLTTMQHQRWHRRKLTPRLWAQQQDPVPAIDFVHNHPLRLLQVIIIWFRSLTSRFFFIQGSSFWSSGKFQEIFTIAMGEKQHSDRNVIPCSEF